MLRLFVVLGLIFTSSAFAKGVRPRHICTNNSDNDISGKYLLKAVTCINSRNGPWNVLPVPKLKMVVERSENFCSKNEYAVTMIDGEKVSDLGFVLVDDDVSLIVKAAQFEDHKESFTVSYNFGLLTVTQIAGSHGLCPEDATKITTFIKLWW